MSETSNLSPEVTPVSNQNDTWIAIAVGSRLASVDEALRGSPFDLATGWKADIMSHWCFAPLAVSPKAGVGLLDTTTPEQWKMVAEPDWSCSKCCSPKEKGWRTYTLKRKEDDSELLTFRYRQRLCICSCLGERIAEIFMPGRDERIGWIECGHNFRVGSKLTDCVTGKVFIVSNMKDDYVRSITISDDVGNPVADCKSTRCTSSRSSTTWMGFEMEWLSSMANTPMPISSRVVLVVGFQMWVLMYREGKDRCCITKLFCVFLLIVFFGWLKFQNSGKW